MEFEHVTFDLPHDTFHALQGGDPDGRPTLVLHGFPDHPPTAKPFLAELGRRGRHVGAARAPAGEHARASEVLPGDAATRHARGDAPPVSADHGAPAAAPRRRRRLHPPPQVDDGHRFAAPHALEVVPDVGHFLHIEAPEAIAERIAAWAE
jgi:pimeloyl-ACP methyl ester carboxylesterase